MITTKHELREAISQYRKRYGNSIKNYIKGIIFLPIFYLSWVPINLIALFEKELKWEKIEHKKSVSLESILTLNYINNGLNIEK